MALDPAAHRLSDSENQRIFDARIKPRLFAGVASSLRPAAVIFGGQPGSGKSAALDLAADDLAKRGGAVQIIGDDLRVFHPDNARLMREDDKIAAIYTGPDSSRWVEKAIAYAKQQRFNIIIEGTMRDSNVVAATMTGLRDAGYEIDARALAVAFRLSEQGIYQRYENQKADRGEGRMTTPEAHRAAYDGLPITLARIESEKLADRVTIYRRGAVAIYENELRDGQWQREPQAAAVLETERARPLTPAEAQAYRDGFDALAVLIGAPGRNATPDEIAEIEQLQAASRVFASPDVSPEAPTFDAARYWELTAADGSKAIATDSAKLGIDQSADLTAYSSRRCRRRLKTADICRSLD